MNRTPSGTALATAITLGALSWLMVAYVTGRREAWDSELYFTVVLPSLGLLAGLLAFVAPERPWRWAFWPFAGQAAVAFIQNPTANLMLMPVGLIAFAFFGALCLIPAYLGAWLRRRLAGRT
jgi:hypothetical protein